MLLFRCTGCPFSVEGTVLNEEYIPYHSIHRIAYYNRSIYTHVYIFYIALQTNKYTDAPAVAPVASGVVGIARTDWRSFPPTATYKEGNGDKTDGHPSRCYSTTRKGYNYDIILLEFSICNPTLQTP